MTENGDIDVGKVTAKSTQNISPKTQPDKDGKKSTCMRKKLGSRVSRTLQNKGNQMSYGTLGTMQRFAKRNNIVPSSTKSTMINKR